MKISISISEDCELFDAISKAAPISANNVKRLIKERETKVNGKRVDGNVALKKGDCVECFVPQAMMGKLPSVVYEDDNILVADKPVLIEVEPTLRNMLVGDRTFFEPIHRIDRNTVGLVVFAKNERAYAELTDAIKHRKITKRYLAVTDGEPKVGEYVAYLRKDPVKGVCRISASPRNGYKKIVTIVEKTERSNEHSLVEIRLVTGRTHQIRAHLAYLGCPIVGDGKYGNGRGPYQKLCAYKLVFNGLEGEMRYLNEKVFVSEQKIID